MPDTYGKRQREGVKAKKAEAREARRIARAKRREAIAAGIVDPPGENDWLASPNPNGGENAPNDL
jgi:hypothetical protein